MFDYLLENISSSSDTAKICGQLNNLQILGNSEQKIRKNIYAVFGTPARLVVNIEKSYVFCLFRMTSLKFNPRKSSLKTINCFSWYFWYCVLL